MARVLVACEFSGIVRDAFRARGHDAWSCDLLPSEQPGPHLQMGAAQAVRLWAWDMLIAHPPCTFLTRAGDRWYANSPERQTAADFVAMLALQPIPRIAIENPRGALNRLWRRPDQVIQPWMFGHGETKATCLWLKNLPPLMATAVNTGREHRVHRAAPGPNRWKERSRTLQGIAEAMADQWGSRFPTTPGRAQSVVIPGWVPEPLANVSGDHWRKREKKLKAAQIMVWAAAKQAGIVPIAGRAKVTVTLTFGVKRRRDIDNLYSRCKGLIDGLVKLGVIEDDDTEHLDLIVKADVRAGGLSTLIELEEATWISAR